MEFYYYFVSGPFWEQGDQVFFKGLAIQPDAFDTFPPVAVPNMNVVGGTTEDPADPDLIQACRQAGVNPEALVLRPDAEDVARNGVIVPGSRPRKPGVFCLPGYNGILSCDHL